MTVPLPAEARREILADYGHDYRLKTFVETGTADGATCWALKDLFAQLHTIEVDEGLWEQATARFRDYSQVTCWHGDSAVALAEVLDEIRCPALFWLDGHWCAHGHNPNGPDSPLPGELAAIFDTGASGDVILIDDARLFREGDDWASEGYDWPALSWVREQAEDHDYRYELADDIIRLTPT